MADILAKLQELLLYAASFVVVLSVVVFVHEFGHFQVARWRKVAIDTFSIGFGKTLFGWRDKQGVQWKIGALPLGGYVKFADDVDAMSSAPRERLDDPDALAEARKKGLFHAQPLLTRALVVAAGPTTNFIFSILAFGLLVGLMGRDMTDYSAIPARVMAVAPGTVADEAGVQPNDIVRSVNGQNVTNFTSLVRLVSSAPEGPISVVIDRDGQVLTMDLTPSVLEGRRVLGVTGPLVLDSERTVERYGPLQAIAVGASDTWSIIAQTGSYIGAVFAGRESGNQIAGPLGIINVSGQVATGALAAPNMDWPAKLQRLGLALLNLAAVLSVAVGFVNLLPIPILDGGHLLFYGIEGLRGGKPLPAAAQEWAYRAGFAVMASLFLFATWNDITRLLPGAQ